MLSLDIVDRKMSQGKLAELESQAHVKLKRNFGMTPTSSDHEGCPGPKKDLNDGFRSMNGCRYKRCNILMDCVDGFRAQAEKSMDQLGYSSLSRPMQRRTILVPDIESVENLKSDLECPSVGPYQRENIPSPVKIFCYAED
jgi:hypothetical protein